MSKDETEPIRRAMVQKINTDVSSNDEQAERTRLEKIYTKVWDTSELQQDFTVRGFRAPFIVVTRKADGKSGSLMFQHYPRFYFNFKEK
jgi:hypothetical protein